MTQTTTYVTRTQDILHVISLYILIYIKYTLVSKNDRMDFDVYLWFLFAKRLTGRITRPDQGTVSVIKHSGSAFSLLLSILSYVSVFTTCVLESFCLYPNHYFLHFNESVIQIDDNFAPLLIVDI